MPLNQVGRQQAAAAAALMGELRPASLVSSPVHRTVETAQILAQAGGWELPVDTHPGLGEFRMGDWDTKTLNELQGLEAWRFYLQNPAQTTFPAGESLVEIRARAVDAINELVARSSGGSLVVVSHGGIVRLVLMAAFGTPLTRYHSTHVENGSSVSLSVSCGRSI